MIRALYTAASGMMFEGRRFDLTSNNLYHVTTTGYKASRDLRSALPTPGGASLTDVQAAYAGEYLDATPGAVRATEADLDLALEGDGFFAVQTRAGVAYTRDGRFRRGADGTVTDWSGNALLGEGGLIRFPPGAGPDAKVEVSQTGAVRVDGKEVGRLLLRSFPGYRGLERISGGIFRPTGAVADAPASPLVLQRHLEAANVSGVSEMVRMIESLRAFESYQKMLQAVDETTGEAVRRIGAVG